MQNTNERQLSFPQKNWLLLCLLTAVATTLTVNWIHNAAERKLYQQSIEVRRHDTSGRDSSNQLKSPPSSGGASGKMNPSAGAAKDTGQKSKSMSPPAGAATGKKNADSAKY